MAADTRACLALLSAPSANAPAPALRRARSRPRGAPGSPKQAGPVARLVTSGTAAGAAAWEPVSFLIGRKEPLKAHLSRAVSPFPGTPGGALSRPGRPYHHPPTRPIQPGRPLELSSEKPRVIFSLSVSHANLTAWFLFLFALSGTPTLRAPPWLATPLEPVWAWDGGRAGGAATHQAPVGGGAGEVLTGGQGPRAGLAGQAGT